MQDNSIVLHPCPFKGQLLTLSGTGSSSLQHQVLTGLLSGRRNLPAGLSLWVRWVRAWKCGTPYLAHVLRGFKSYLWVITKDRWQRFGRTHKTQIICPHTQLFRENNLRKGLQEVGSKIARLIGKNITCTERHMQRFNLNKSKLS